MRTLLISLFLLATVVTARAQNNCKVVKAYAYYTVSLPGMQMTDDQGNPITPKATIGRFIYMEWRGTDKPNMETILYNNIALVATITPVKGKSVIPGSELNPKNVSAISIKKSNSLWKIELQPEADNTMPDRDCKNIMIRIKGTPHPCSFKLVKETQLMTMPRY